MIQTQNLSIQLRPYQLEALRTVEAKFVQGITRQAISAPTGAGKTIMFAELINRRQHLGCSLVLAHRDELVQQAIDKIKVVIPNAQVGKVKAESNESSAPIVVASVQTLSRDSRLQQLTSDFQTIIVDEAHHAAAFTYCKILSYLGCLGELGEGEQKKERNPLLLGVSATLERADKAALGEIFQEVVYQIDLLHLIENQYLVDLSAQRIEIKGFNADNVSASNGDLVESQLAEAMTKANAPWQVAEAFISYASERKAIVFTPSVKLAEDTAECLQEQGVSAEALSGNTEARLRHNILGRLKSGATQVVVNCGVLTEGFDEPSVDCVVVARPTKSKSLFIQMIGRGTRPYFNKKNCLILDCVGASAKHDLVSVPSLLGLNAKVGIGAGVKDLTNIPSLASLLEEKATQGYKFVDGQLVARSVDLFAFRRQKQNINWLTLSPQFHAINLGNNKLLVVAQSNNQQWGILKFIDKNIEVLHSNLTLDLAISVSEEIARNEARNLINTGASWRTDPASPKQIETLHMFNLLVKPNMTKGEAGDLLTLFFARQQLRNLARKSA